MKIKKTLSLVICIVLSITMALTAIGCKDNQTDNPQYSAVIETKPTVKFKFTVVHKDGSEKTFTVTTDKSTVGAALLQEGIIAGDKGAYGLYVKTVDGETLDYDADGYWWIFYENDKQSANGVDLTKIEQGKSYSFKAEKS